MTDLTRISVPIARDEAQIIIELARKEFRQPREQARALIHEALRARGAIGERIYKQPPAQAAGERT